MPLDETRAHGVTPELNRDYRTRTANQQAAFVLPYLRPDMTLLDIGCGPGTITIGLAEVVTPGQVIGIDHDYEHIAAARALASERQVTNITFELPGIKARKACWNKFRPSRSYCHSH